MTITRREFILSALAFIASALYAGVFRTEKPCEVDDLVLPVRDAYARAVLATGPVMYHPSSSRWAYLKDLQVIMPADRVAREE